MGLLGDIYSTIDSKKRQLKGLLADPVETLKLGLLNFKNDQNALLDTQAQAYPFIPRTQDQQARIPTFARTQEQARKELADHGANMGIAAATVWHGSPHKFDKFDSSKIGTGEGAQAYGHGLYLAESPTVAKQYADSVKDMGAIKDINKELSRLADVMQADTQFGQYRKFKSSVGEEAAKQYDELMAKRSGVSSAPGTMYKVDLPDEAIAKMLDWDKPLSQQAPEVQKALSQAVEKRPNMTGAELYNVFGGIGKLDQTLNTGFPFGMSASQQLKEKGIPGIRYLDGGSRGAGSGTSNYVVFPGNEDLLTILERNGQGLLGQ